MTAFAADPTPASLLARLREKNATADWDRFAELYTPLLYAYGRKLGLPEPDARELVQEVFVVLLSKLRQFQPDQGRFRGWLWTITRNKLIDRIKSRREEAAGGDEVVDASALDNVSEWSEDEWRRHVIEHLIRIMKTDFTEPTWRACWLCVVESRSPADVARELNMPVASVYQAKTRVLRRLRQEAEGMLD